MFVVCALHYIRIFQPNVSTISIVCYYHPVTIGLSIHILGSRAAFLKLWSADYKWSSGSALVVLLD